MEIPLGRVRLTITIVRVSGQPKHWEYFAAICRDDHELARLNRRNTHDYDGAPWTGLRLIHRGGRRP